MGKKKAKQTSGEGPSGSGNVQSNNCHVKVEEIKWEPIKFRTESSRGSERPNSDVGVDQIKFSTGSKSSEISQSTSKPPAHKVFNWWTRRTAVGKEEDKKWKAEMQRDKIARLKRFLKSPAGRRIQYRKPKKELKVENEDSVANTTGKKLSKPKSLAKRQSVGKRIAQVIGHVKPKKKGRKVASPLPSTSSVPDLPDLIKCHQDETGTSVEKRSNPDDSTQPQSILGKRSANETVQLKPKKKCLKVTSTLQNLSDWIKCHQDELAILSDDLKIHFDNNSQRQVTLDRKMFLREFIHERIRSRYPHSLLVAVGSTINQTGSENSDLDLCLVVPDAYGETPLDKPYATQILREVRKCLKKCREFVQPPQLIPARVPILRLTGRAADSFEVDINVNNIIGIHNSHLIHHYASCDTRFPLLSLVVKHWATQAGIKDAMNGTFNSYSLALMVLHFLQQVKPAVLPNLQELFPHQFSVERPLNRLELFVSPPEFADRSANTQNVGELLLGFFDYFVNQFEYADWAISIREASVVERYENPEDSDQFFIYIEEPFDSSNTARSVRCPNEIVSAFRRTYQALRQHPHISTLDVY